MLYSLLGRLVWHGGKLVLRRKLRSSPVSKKPVLGVAAAVTVAGVLVVLQRRGGE